MASCRKLAPALLRVADGEATPEETLRVGRHVPDCTACRILLARERRILALFDRLDDPLPVENAWVEELMRAIPKEPPARAGARTERRRSLRLVGVVAVLALGGALSGGALAGLVRAVREPMLPRIDVESGESILGSLSGLLAAVSLVLDRIGGDLRVFLPWGWLGEHLGSLAILPAGLAILTLWALAAVAAASYARH